MSVHPVFFIVGAFGCFLLGVFAGGGRRKDVSAIGLAALMGCMLTMFIVWLTEIVQGALS